LRQLLTERYRARLAGVLSCYDRIIVTGTLLGGPSMTTFFRWTSTSTRAPCCELVCPGSKALLWPAGAVRGVVGIGGESPLSNLMERWVHRNPLRAAASASRWAPRVARSILDADRGSIFNAG
jgi:hypothetical protein